MRSTKLAATFAALALGSTLCALPALAQNYHYGRNDGGFVTNDTSAVKTGQIAPRAPKTGQTGWNSSYNSYDGRADTGRGVYNSFGGTYGGENHDGQGLAPAQRSKYPVGRSMNDGGISTSQFDKGAERSGSNSNREAFRSGSENYSYGGQGRMPRTAPNAYGYSR